MATWPDLTDYHEALQHPAQSFSDPQLQRASIALDRFGMPKPSTGGNAVVYEATEAGQTWAVRCFLRPISDHAERYAAISAHLPQAARSRGARFEFLAQGVKVRGAWFPVVKMEWVQGELLDRWVAARVSRPQELARLRERFRALLLGLEADRVAHGDLQHGNVLVQGDDLRLIDYDGMWVPALAGRRATEIGHRAYQHPRRSEAHYGPTLDRFSALAIYVALAALEQDPELWERYHTGDNLLFVREDWEAPGKTPLWEDLAGLADAEVVRLAGVLATCAEGDPTGVPRLEDVLRGQAQVAPRKLEPGPPRAPARPRWTKRAAATGSIAELAPRWKVVWMRPGERVEARWKKELRDVPVEVEVPLGLERLAPAAVAAGVGVVSAAALTTISVEGGLLAAGGGLTAAAVLAVNKLGATTKRVETRRQEVAVKEQVKVATEGHRSAVVGLACTADGRRVTSIAKLGECGTWDTHDDAWRPGGVRLPPYERAVMALNAPTRFAISSPKAVTSFDIARGKKVEHPVEAAKGPPRALAITADGGRLALAYAAAVEVVEAETRKPVVRVEDPGGSPSALAFSEDGQLLLVGLTNGNTAVYRLGTQAERLSSGAAHRAAIAAVAVAGKGQSFASIDAAGFVTFWSKDGQKHASATLGAGGARALCFVGDHTARALAVGAHGTVKVLDTDTGRVLATHAIGAAAVTALAYARAKAALAVGTTTGQVAVLALED